MLHVWLNGWTNKPNTSATVLSLVLSQPTHRIGSNSDISTHVHRTPAGFVCQVTYNLWQSLRSTALFTPFLLASTRIACRSNTLSHESTWNRAWIGVLPTPCGEKSLKTPDRSHSFKKKIAKPIFILPPRCLSSSYHTFRVLDRPLSYKTSLSMRWQCDYYYIFAYPWK
jgi:hypothetical protein